MPAQTLQEGIALLKAGQPEAARQVFLGILKTDPRQELAWLGLAETVSDPAQRITVLEKCLSFLPESEKARTALDALWLRRTAPSPQTPAPEPFKPQEPTNLEQRIAAQPREPEPITAVVAAHPTPTPTTQPPAPSPDTADVRSLRESVTQRKGSFWRLVLGIVAVLVVLGTAIALLWPTLQNLVLNGAGTPQPSATPTVTRTPDAARTATARADFTATPAFTPQPAALQAVQSMTWNLPAGDIPSSLSFAGEEMLIVGANSGTLRMYQLPEANLLLEQPLPDGALKSLAVSPNLADLVTAASNKALYSWSMTTSASLPLQTAQRLELPMPECGRQELCSPASLAISPDGKILALGIEDHFQGFENKVWLFQRSQNVLRADWALLQQLQNPAQSLPGSINALTFLDQGRFLATASGQWITLWQTKDWQVYGSLTEVSDVLSSLAADPQNRWLAGLGMDGRLNIWPISLASPTFSAPAALLLDAHQGRGAALATDPSGTWLITAGDDLVLQIWLVNSPQNVQLTQSISLPAIPRALAFAPTGLRFALALDDGTVTLWELK